MISADSGRKEGTEEVKERGEREFMKKSSFLRARGRRAGHVRALKLSLLVAMNLTRPYCGDQTSRNQNK